MNRRPLRQICDDWLLYVCAFDPRPSVVLESPSRPQPQPPSQGIRWLSKDDKTSLPTDYLPRRTTVKKPAPYKYKLQGYKEIEYQILILDPNTNHYRLMWKCTKCRTKKAIRHAIYDWKLYPAWREMLCDEIMHRKCDRCRQMTIGSLTVQSSMY
ncbi:hypothetical protein ABEB36_013871 [Hypothenemus hampei]|uniref:Zinc-binding domain-containing protein n=1 Tax=Hypothenemus hampei TaxID=57062 RepID=A0ABD1E7N8_HYPHA